MPETPPLVDELLDLVDDGRAEEALSRARSERRRAAKRGDAELDRELRLVEAVALGQLGEPAAALPILDALLRETPDDVDARLERANARWELCRFDEARADLEEVLRASPDAAWAHHLLGLLAERRGDGAEAQRRLRRARALAPEDFPEPVTMSRAAFDRAVEVALEDIPESVRRWLANVPILVEDVPDDDDLRGSDPPLPPTILGLFRGAPFGQKGSMDPWSQFPSSIVLYQRNLERAAEDRDHLVEEIGVTLVHEVGHYLGLDEDELWERGLG